MEDRLDKIREKVAELADKDHDHYLCTDNTCPYDVVLADILAWHEEEVRKNIDLTEYDGRYDLLSPHQQLILKRYHHACYKKLEQLSKSNNTGENE